MKQSNYTVQILEPNEGYKLTQANEVELKNRVFSEKVFLAVNDSASNWKEISNEEAEQIKEQQLAKLEEERLEEEKRQQEELAKLEENKED